ncbi:single-stranded DNA-binding protein [Pedobacter sp. PLR]|uniref:single-stranded DNA-binding protein n=1 Tax=Pedobacter sp. PLR TaxID=2994465 RepID=UPI0022484D80|nr:single-stranded DNA-binding protein [Pedobacter sp. PLR]MCX2450832.1 single-stranded DNA-binding protein [Pedobacter sp. PLR]
MKNFRNTVSLTGHAGADPVVVSLAGERKVARVSMAINEFYKNQSGEAVCQTQWISLVFWNKKAELAELLIKKGVGLSIEGSLKTQSYTDKQGDQRSSTEIFVNHMELVTQTDA